MNLLDVVPAGDGSGFDWPALCEAFDWIATLQGVPQDPVHHAEGDVATHVRMACEALLDGEAWRTADAGRRLRPFLAVLLHDVAKPACTRRESEGRVSSRGHSRRGAVRAREILWRAGIDVETREAVCGIVEHHQVPFWLLERDDPPRLAIDVAVTTSWNELCIHADADARGRICRDHASLIERVAPAGEMARELGCFDAPRTFASDRTRIAYLQRKRDDALHGDPAGLEPRCTATMVCGLPGSGKDTWIAANMQDHPVVSLDAIRAELGVNPTDGQGRVASAARDRARVHLRAGTDFVLNATNVSRDMRSRWVNLCRDYDAAVQIVFVEADPATLRERNQRRDRPVPWPVIERMIRRWEHPNKTEAERVRTVVGCDGLRSARRRWRCCVWDWQKLVSWPPAGTAWESPAIQGWHVVSWLRRYSNMTSHSETGMDRRNRACDLLVSLVLMAAVLTGMVPVASCGRSNRGPSRGESFIAFDTPPEVLHAEPAEYPKSARVAEDEGTVSVLITIDEKGAVIDARVIRTDAAESLQLAALEAARKWIFRPASMRGVPVQVEVGIPFRFTLGN